MADVENLGRLAANNRRAENTLPVAANLNIEMLLDDVDDLVDHQTHGTAGV